MTSWTTEQMGNASLIIDIGKAMNMSMRDIQTALIAAMQESSLRNLTYGSGDSLGLFQQRPSQGWGTPQQIMDPSYSIRKFYGSLSKVGNRKNLSAWQAAQEVQKSAYPDAYKKWIPDSDSLLDKVSVSAMQTGLQSLYSSYTTGSPDVLQEPVGLPDLQGTADLLPNPVGLEESLPAGLGAPGTDVPSQYSQLDEIDRLVGAEPEGVRGQIVDTLKQYLGTPYKWGGAKPGAFDCSGLIYYVYNKLGIKPIVNGRPGKVPRVSYDQAFMGQHTDISKLQPGDFVVFGGDAHHIAIYLGNGQILEAPHTGAKVRIRDLGDNENAWGVHLDLGGY